MSVSQSRVPIMKPLGPVHYTKKGKIVSDICGLFVSKKGLYILVHMGVFVSSSIHGA